MMDGRSASALYGFDVRDSPGLLDPAWTSARRAAYLLDPDVIRPLSVDRNVWTSPLAGVPTDGAATDYWRDLAALRRAIQSVDLLWTSVAVVALAVVLDRSEARTLDVAPKPSRATDFWKPIGWDVADTGLVSALSNCALPSDILARLRHDFGSRLNEHGLFGQVSDASAYRAVADHQIPESAPFLVHQLYLVPATADNLRDIS